MAQDTDSHPGPFERGFADGDRREARRLLARLDLARAGGDMSALPRLLSAARLMLGADAPRGVADVLAALKIRAADRQEAPLADFGLGAAPFTHGDVEITRIERPYDGYGHMRRYVLRHPLYKGGMGEEISRECFVTGNAVVLLPYDPAREKVLLVEQFRVAPYAQGADPWLVECVAGRFEEGESVEDVARREAVEEAGITVGDMVRMGDYYSSPGIFFEEIAYFCGRFDSAGAGGLHGLEEESEDIRAIVVGLDEALSAVDKGRIVCGPCIIALLWLARHRGELKARWT